MQADIDSPSSLLSAFRGAHVIFGLTDFWGPYFSVFNEKKKEGDRATGEYAYEIEVRRGKNIVDAVEKVLEEEGSVLERFVLSSLPGFKAQSGGKYTFVYHFDSKAVVTEYLRGKGRLWERSSVLNMGFYADNLVRYGGILGAAKVCVSFSLSFSPSFPISSFILYFIRLANAKIDESRIWRTASTSGASPANPQQHTPSSSRPTQASS